METAKTDACHKHPKYDPFDKTIRDIYDPMCNTCHYLFMATEHVGRFSGERIETDEGSKNAQYRIGPMSLVQFGCMRYYLGFFFYNNRILNAYYTDNVNRIIYVDGEICTFVSERCEKLGCVLQRRVRNPPLNTLQLLIFSLKEGPKKFWSTLRNPPKTYSYKNIELE